MVPRIQLLLGAALFALLGSVLVLAGLGVVAVPLEQLQAPLWVVALAGFVFLCCAGLLLLVATAKTEPSSSLPLAWRFVAMLAVAAVGAIAAWVAFGDGPREFTGSSSALGMSQQGSVAEAEGRFAFGILAVFSGLVVVLGLVQAWFEARARRTG
ncbi:MAG: hypothetical protein H7124_01850 [Phycisphaerales bacterium]|nr:hypothetical protein [Hyphomonadaceae bacterium]